MKRKRRTKAQIEADPHRTGRPSLGTSAKSRNVVIRVSEIEYESLQGKAQRAGVSVSAFIMAPHRKGKG